MPSRDNDVMGRIVGLLNMPPTKRALRLQGLAVISSGTSGPFTTRLWSAAMVSPELFAPQLRRARERASSYVVDLSAYRKAGELLEQMVESWLDAGGDDIERWRKANPVLFARLQKVIGTMPALFTPEGLTVLPPTSKPRKDQPLANVMHLFALMIDHVVSGQSSAKIGRCRYCDRYYVNRAGRKDSRYCPGTDCGSRATATKAVMHSDEDRAEKIRTIKRAVQSWPGPHPHKVRTATGDVSVMAFGSMLTAELRDYVVKSTGLNKRFVTRALNRDKHLKEYVEGEHAYVPPKSPKKLERGSGHPLAKDYFLLRDLRAEDEQRKIAKKAKGKDRKR